MTAPAPLRNIIAYSDGGAIGNPGPGGYGVVLRYGEKVKELSAGFRLTTNNRMELLGAIVALEALAILEGYDMAAIFEADEVQACHLILEAIKLAYADAAATVADARFLKAPIELLLDPAFIAARRACLDRDHASENPPAGRVFGDTTYLTVVDRNRMAVSLITSISGPFGSGLVVPGTGVVLNNRLADFVLVPGHPNAAAPAKRVRHTILPSMVLGPDGQLKMSFGCMGGNMQPQGQVQILLNLIDRGMNLQQAIDAPRLRVLDGKRVSIEPHPLPDLGKRLASMGHVVFGTDLLLLRRAMSVRASRAPHRPSCWRPKASAAPATRVWTASPARFDY